MKNKLNFSVILTYTLILFITSQSYFFISSSAGERLQTFTLYTEDGRSENYTSNEPSLLKVSQIVQNDELESICSQTGVWAFFTQANYKDINSYGYHPAIPEWSCNERRVSAYRTHYQSIRHLGNVDLDEPGISLYSDPLFAHNELYFDGHSLSLSSPFYINSFGFTGADNFTIFKGPNFTGDGLCLVSENDKRQEEEEGQENNGRNYNDYRSSIGSGFSGVTFEEKLSFRVGSIRKTCYGSQIWLVDGQFVRPLEILNYSVLLPSFQNINGEEAEPANYIDSLELLKLEPISSYPNAPAFFMSGKELNFPTPQRFKNFTTTMDSNWKIYTQMDFSGESLCLSGNGSLNDSFSSIGSIRYGCEDEEVNSTTTASASCCDDESETTTITSTDSVTETLTPGTSDYSDRNNFIENGQQGQRRGTGRVSSTFSVMDLDENSSDGTTSGGAGGGNAINPTRRGRILQFDPTTTTPANHNHNHNDIFDNEILKEEIGNSSEAIQRFYNQTSSLLNNYTRSEKISTADTNTILFTGFIIVLVLLILCIIMAIAMFIYFRSTRNKGSGEVRPIRNTTSSPTLSSPSTQVST